MPDLNGHYRWQQPDIKSVGGLAIKHSAPEPNLWKNYFAKNSA
jgi:hypothetical protein